MSSKSNPPPSGNSLPFPSPSRSPTNSMAQPPPSSFPSTARRMPYYTPINPRQFSSSAAKRESVMALGSIAHLQHYFVRNGLASKNRSTSHKNMVLAIPGRDPDCFSEEDEEALQNLPPEPAPPPPKPAQPSFPPGRVLPNLTDLESARQEVMAQLDQVCEAWGLVQLSATRAPSVASNRSGDDDFNLPLASTGFQNLQPSSQFSSFKREHHDDGEGFVVNLLALTTRAVRSVQKFILTIPDPDVFSSSNIVSLGGALERRMSHLELSTAARPRTSTPRSIILGPSSSGASTPSRSESPAPNSRRVTSGFDPFALFKKRANAGSIMIPSNSSAQTAKDDPLTILRKMSLEVLGSLKEIEHKFRIPGSAIPTNNHDLSMCQSDQNYSMQQTETKILDQDHENSEGVLLLPAMSWEYRQDVTLDEMREEAIVVKRWLECVDGILEGMKIISGSRRPSSRLSSVTNHSQKDSSNKKKSTMPKERNVLKKILGSSKLAPNHSNNQGVKVPDISFDNATSDDENISGEDEDEELLPDWARNDRFESVKSSVNCSENDGSAREEAQLARLFSCLVSHLPIEFLSHLCPPHGDNGSRIGFLDSLSDGTLLCLAYNVVLRKSQRPWGFIPVETIHNLTCPSPPSNSLPLVSSPKSNESSFSRTNGESDSRLKSPQLSSTTRLGPSSSMTPSEISESTFANHQSPVRVGMTFRRMENVKVWAAALKLRYLIKSEVPNSFPQDRTTTASDAQPQNDGGNSNIVTFIKFEPLVIARKSQGWDTMLQYIACKWLDSIRSEKREEVLFSPR